MLYVIKSEYRQLTSYSGGLFFLQSASLISSEALWDAGGSRSSGNNVGVKVKHYESKQFEFPICRLRNRVETPIFFPVKHLLSQTK